MNLFFSNTNKNFDQYIKKVWFITSSIPLLFNLTNNLITKSIWKVKLGWCTMLTCNIFGNLFWSLIQTSMSLVIRNVEWEWIWPNWCCWNWISITILIATFDLIWKILIKQNLWEMINNSCSCIFPLLVEMTRQLFLIWFW